MAHSIKPLAVALLLAAGGGLAQQQVNDPDFTGQVEHPAFTKSHPRIGIDEAHRNFHTRNGRYKPFAALMESDGFVVTAAPHFDARSLKGVDILVIANAMGEFLDNTTGAVRKGAMGPAFTLVECDTVGTGSAAEDRYCSLPIMFHGVMRPLVWRSDSESRWVWAL